MSTLTEIGDYLEDEECGTQAVDLFLNKTPDSPDKVLVVYQYPGGPGEYIQDSPSPSRESIQIQVVARAVKFEDAEALAYKAYHALAPVVNTTLGSTRYVSIKPNHSPALMGRDTNDRSLVYFNATVDKEVSLAPVS